jgi:hypothetical protein
MAETVIIGTPGLELTTAPLVTYSIETPNTAGAANKTMLTLLNPLASVKVIKVRLFWIYVPNPTGTTVIINHELRRFTGVPTGGTPIVPARHDLNDLPSVAVANVAPTAGMVDVELIRSTVVQTNAFTAPSTYQFPPGLNGAVGPWVIRAGQGIYLKQITAQTNSYRIGMTFTEE